VKHRAAAIALVALVALVVIDSPLAGRASQRGIQNTPPLQITVEEVLLAADRMRADRWYPEESEVGDEHGGRLSRAADMDLLVLASKHPRPDLRYIAVREFGRFETPSNVTFLATFLNDPSHVVRVGAADALVQSVLDHPEATREIAAAIAAMEDRLTREVLSPDRSYLWLRLAELPLRTSVAVKYEREWIQEIQHLKELRVPAAEALLRMFQAHPRQVDATSETAVENWARAGLAQGDTVVKAGSVERGRTLQFLEILQAMRADNDQIASDAAQFTCRVDSGRDPVSCAAPIRDLGVRLLNPQNPGHQFALDRAAKDRLHPIPASTAIRKLISSPEMPICILVRIAQGLEAERDVIEALARVKPVRYEACVDWDPSLYLLNEARLLGVSTTGHSWAVPAAAYETLATRVAASKEEHEWRESLLRLHTEVGTRHVRWEVRATAARVATTLEDVETLSTLSTDDHHNVRAEAITGLALLKSPLVVAAAVDALEISDDHLTITAATALARIRSGATATEAVYTALDRLTRERRDTSRRARLALLERLAVFITPTSVDADIWTNKLRPLLNDFDPIVASAAASVMEKVSMTQTYARPTRRPASQPNAAQLVAIPPCISFKFAGTLEDIPLVLDRLTSPLAIARLVELINAGYYNGTVVHRLDENLGITGSPAGNDEGGLNRVIRDEVGNRESGPQLVLMAHERDHADGRLGIRFRANPARVRRETVLGRFVDFKGMTKGVTVSRVWVGAAEPYRRTICNPKDFGIPEITRASVGSR
jgi:cyclophilin family peptidyl-prolyl cis-trans isomerase/HEAT repeat protein